MKAEPTDMNIVCSTNSVQVKSEAADPNMQVLHLEKIINHPNYSPGTVADLGPDLKGPYAGADIAVYHLTEASKTKLKKAMRPTKLWPACLPKKNEDYTEKRGIFAGWVDQEPFYKAGTDSIQTYELNFLTLRAMQVNIFLGCTSITCHSLHHS